MSTSPSTTSACETVRQRMLAAVGAYLCGGGTRPLYLTTRDRAAATAMIGAAAAELRAAGRGERMLACTGADFAALWRAALRRGLTPFTRRALAARQSILLTDLEALRDEPFAQWELARLVAPGRLIILAGRHHLRHVAAWSPPLAAGLRETVSLCLHEGPCVTEADAQTIVALVANYYGLTRAAVLSRRRTGPIVRARQMAMTLLREQGLTYNAVGHVLRRDHTTAMHGHARIRQLSAQQPGVRHELDRLRRASAA